VEFVATGANVALVSAPVSVTLADALFLLAVTGYGTTILASGYHSLRAWTLDMDLLMSTAIVGALTASVGFGAGLYMEAALLAVLFGLAELLESHAMDRARGSLRELMNLSPDEATVRRDGEELTVPVEEVTVGETVIVRPGDLIPVDGTVREGASAVDEAPVTGESIPVEKAAGDPVYAGTIAEEGYLEVEVTAPPGEDTLSRVVELVENARANRTEREQFVDRFASVYTPIVVSLAALTAVLPPLLIDGATTVDVAGYAVTFTGDPITWFVYGLTLVVLACPCAFVISTPVSVVSGVTSAAKNGVLVKGGDHLEAMGEVDVVAMDKTGTLTEGDLAVTDVVSFGGVDDSEVLARATAVESRSEHPIAEAVVARAEEDGVERPSVTEFESLTGKGVRAVVDGTNTYVGKPELFRSLGFDLSHVHVQTDGGAVTAAGACEDVQCRDLQADTVPDLQAAGKTVVFVGSETELYGVVAVADEVRPETAPAIARLRDLGVGRVVMLTGDNERTARAVAEAAGVDEFEAGLLPEEKVASVERLEGTHGTVAMVGDGVNDAPALAMATVGVAMGAAGTDTAIETADVALMSDDLSRLPYLYDLSRGTNGVIRGNVWTSLGAKAALAVGVPFGLVPIWAAVLIGDAGMTLAVTGNAARLGWIDADG
jgi:Cd2+/Zn2+-exporting ATPase